MGALLSYSIISGVILLTLYLGYRLFLSRDNQHRFNRSVILAIYIISFATLPVVTLIDNTPAKSTGITVISPTVKAQIGSDIIKSDPIWGTILIWVFMAGMTIVLIRTAIIWIRLTAIIRSGEKIRRGSHILVVTDNSRYAPFSWMRYVVMSRSDCETNYSAIIAHELKHIRSRHWADLAIAQMACIVNWFNPAVWLMRDELMLVHEYQADMAVIDAGYDAQDYQKLLIKKAVGTRFASIANSFNHSNLKKRITMMYKEKSRAGHRLKALALVPMFTFTLGAISLPVVRAAVSTISNSSISISEGSENPSNDNDSVTVINETIGNSDIRIVGVGTIKKSPSDSIITRNSTGEASAQDGQVTYLLNGKEISAEEMKNIAVETIESVTVNKQSNIILITTK